MMRFSNSASPEGASEENLAIYARATFCQIDPKMMRFCEFRERRRRERRKFGDLCEDFCQIDPKMMRFLNSASAEGASEENLILCKEFPPNRL